MKHIIQKLFSLSLVIALLTVNASAISFPDVDAGAWYSDAVEYVSELGVMVGDAEGNFNPDKPVTRAEMAIVIYRVLEMTLGGSDYMPAYPAEKNYSDVPETHWANMYINIVSFLEIVKGYGDGRFGPSDTVTYEQAVTMLVRAFGAAADAENRGGYPNGFLDTAKDIGLLAGVRASTGEKLSRANVAVLLFNYLHDGVNENPPIDRDTNPPQDNQVGEEIESAPAPDNQTGDSLEIGDSQQEDQPESGSEPGGVGGGT